jgi:hypothetical protein
MLKKTSDKTAAEAEAAVDSAAELSGQSKHSEAETGKDERPAREQFLGRARYAFDRPESERRRTATGLIYERNHGRTITDGVIGPEVEPVYSVEDVFLYVYGDATGRSYWEAYLFPGKLGTDEVPRADELARLLAKHHAGDFERVRKQIAASLAAVADKSAREMAEHLVADSDTSRFVPPSLRAYLDLRATPAAPTAAPDPGITQKPPKRVRAHPERDRVKAAMRAMVETGDDVFDRIRWPEETMVATFNASREVCRLARQELLEEQKAESPIVGIVGRQRPTMNK